MIVLRLEPRTNEVILQFLNCKMTSFNGLKIDFEKLPHSLGWYLTKTQCLKWTMLNFCLAPQFARKNVQNTFYRTNLRGGMVQQ